MAAVPCPPRNEAHMSEQRTKKVAFADVAEQLVTPGAPRLSETEQAEIEAA